LPQNLRTTFGEDACRTGSPAMNSKPSRGNTAHATDGAPTAWRQLWQWQWVSARASALTR
jgi:hypothetical protein